MHTHTRTKAALRVDRVGSDLRVENNDVVGLGPSVVAGLRDVGQAKKLGTLSATVECLKDKDKEREREIVN
jgi:hypothetical protein